MYEPYPNVVITCGQGEDIICCCSKNEELKETLDDGDKYIQKKIGGKVTITLGNKNFLCKNKNNFTAEEDTDNRSSSDPL